MLNSYSVIHSVKWLMNFNSRQKIGKTGNGHHMQIPNDCEVTADEQMSFCNGMPNFIQI